MAVMAINPVAIVVNTASASQIIAPIPLEVIADTKRTDESSGRFSPDGQWVALSIASLTDAPDLGRNLAFSSTGVPGLPEAGLLRTRLAHLASGETVDLSDADSSTWGLSWSPDGRQLAYYSDKGGEAGIWIWDAATRQSRRLGDVIARPYGSFEIPRWMADGQRLLVKLLPKGMTLAEANRLLPKMTDLHRIFPPAVNGKPMVVVLRSGKKTTEPSEMSSNTFLNGSLADLAVIDVRSGKIERIVKGKRIGNYQFSPDQKHVAYMVPELGPQNRQLPLFELHIVTLGSGEHRILQRKIPVTYGKEFNWSPDSRRIAYPSMNGSRECQLIVHGLDGRKVEFATDLGHACSDANPPLWDRSGRAVYSVGSGTLWRLDLASAKATQLSKLPKVELKQLVARADSNLLWQADGKAWAVARDAETSESLIVSIDLSSGRGRIALRGGEQAIHGGAADVSGAGVISYRGSDPKHLEDLWLFDTRNGKRRQLSRSNAELERYAVGETRRITWVSGRGEKLEGALMLPPGYKPGQKLPTVVKVYGGQRAGPLLTQYGLGMAGMPFANPHVLTTRGYAFFVPDIPVRTGELMSDIYAAVMPGIDALVAQGYADPQRLAVAGHSFGSYTTWALLVQTDRFKAAITTGMGIHPDLFAAYLGHLNYGIAKGGGVGYLETGQGGMGGDPWTHRERYLQNSPVFMLDKLTTPLLMGQGTEDGDLTAPNSMFIALNRLGRSVEYSLYAHEGHTFSGRINIIDFWKRRLDFLHEHLGSEGIFSDRPVI